MKGNLKKIILGALAIVGFTLVLRLPYVHFPKLNPDETIYGVIAREILHGDIPYRDEWELKPPLIFYIYAATFWLFGSISLIPVHVFAVMVMAATALFVGDIARREWGNTAGLIAGLGLAGYSTAGWMTEVNAAETELFLLLPQVLAIERFIRKRPKKIYRDLFVAGLLGGMAAMLKQPAMALIALMGAWVIICPLVKKHRFSSELALLSGAMIVPLIFAIYLFSEGALKDAFNLVFIDNLLYIGERSRGDVLRMIVRSGWNLAGPNLFLWVTAFVSAGVLIVQGLRNKGKYRIVYRHAIFIAFYFMISTVGTFSGVWVNGHYYLMMIPGLVLMWTWGLVKMWPLMKSRAIRYIFAASMIAGMIFPLYYFHLFNRKWSVDTYINSRVNFFTSIGKAIQQETDPDDRIFVWGMNPQIYFFANRRPASRFIYTTFQMGLVEDTFSGHELKGKSRFAMLKTWPLLMNDLEKYQPVFVIDSTPFYMATKPFPIKKYPDLLSFCFDSYDLIFEQNGFLIFKRTLEDLPADEDNSDHLNH